MPSDWYKRNRDKAREQRKRSYQRNKVQEIARNKARYHKNVKMKLINHLGGKCVKCGFSDWRALQLDHINGDGGYEIRDVFKNNIKMYAYYVKHLSEATKRLQLLCANCNWIKRYEQKETGGTRGKWIRAAKLNASNITRLTDFAI